MPFQAVFGGGCGPLFGRGVAR